MPETSIPIPKEAAEKLRALAEANGRDVSSLVGEALTRFLADEGARLQASAGSRDAAIFGEMGIDVD
jgi:predicted transcriptional regulator